MTPQTQVKTYRLLLGFILVVIACNILELYLLSFWQSILGCTLFGYGLGMMVRND